MALCFQHDPAERHPTHTPMTDEQREEIERRLREQQMRLAGIIRLAELQERRPG